MKLFALISGQNEVTGIVQAEDQSQAHLFSELYPQVIDVTDLQPIPQIGWIFDGQNIIGTSVSKKITRLAMNQRFQVSEMLGLLTYVNANPNSIVALLMQRLQITTYVDLSRSDTQAALGALVQLGLITQDRATTILTTPVGPLEAYSG